MGVYMIYIKDIDTNNTENSSKWCRSVATFEKQFKTKLKTENAIELQIMFN